MAAGDPVFDNGDLLLNHTVGFHLGNTSTFVKGLTPNGAST